MNILKEIYRTIIRLPSTLEIAAAELEEAERGVLDARSTMEYAEALVGYNQKRVYRLRKYIAEGGNSDLK